MSMNFSSFGKFSSSATLQPYFEDYLKANVSSLDLHDLVLRSCDNVPSSKRAIEVLAEFLVHSVEDHLLRVFQTLKDTALCTTQQRSDYQDQIGSHIRALLCLVPNVSTDASRFRLKPLFQSPLLSMDSRLNLMICLVHECKSAITEEGNFSNAVI